MENQRDNVIVILAGYNERMQAFMEINEGLKSCIPHWIEFPDYTADELTEIFKLMLSEKGFIATDEVVSEAHYIFVKARNMDNFGDGRYVRNFVEQAIMVQSVRLLSLRNDVKNIRKNELFKLIKEDIKELNEDSKDACVPDTAKDELEQMIGLESVKKVINKAVANFKINKLCMERGITKDKASLHMVFTGNPGTAKTTVARLFAGILKDEINVQMYDSIREKILYDGDIGNIPHKIASMRDIVLEIAEIKNGVLHVYTQKCYEFNYEERNMIYDHYI